jgi:PAS domain S-box-containing protein
MSFPRSRSRATIHLIYVVLAMVSIATVSLSVALVQRAAKNYRVALAENQQRAQRLASFASLRDAALQANAATVRVFVNSDPALQTKELLQATSAFDAAAFSCDAGLHNVSPEEASRTRSELGDMRVIFTEMVESSETILALAGDDRAAAASRLPTMEAALVRLFKRIDQVSDGARSDQLAAFARQNDAYTRLLRAGVFLTSLIALIATAATFFGIRVARELGSAREREEQGRLLRASLDLLLEAEQMATIGTWTWDVPNDDVRWSAELFRIFGMEPVEHLGYDTYISVVHEDDRERVNTIIAEAMRTREQYSFIHRAVLPCGEVRTVRAKGKIECDAEGNIVRMMGVVHDISEQQAMIETLQRKELQLEQAQRLAHLGSWDWFPLTGEGSWSEELYRITGCDPATTPPLAESYEALIHPDDLKEFAKRREAGMANRLENVYDEHRLLRPDGQIVHVVLQARLLYNADGQITKGMGTVQDVTERKMAEASLRLSEERFALAARATTDVIWDYDATTNRVWYNDAWTKRYGYPDREVWDTSVWYDNLHPDDRPIVEERFQKAVADGDEYWTSEYRMRTHSGEWLDIFDRGYLQRDARGNLVRLIGASMNITPQKRSTAELARVSRQMKLVLDSAAEGVFGMDTDFSLNLINAAGAQMLGFEVEELIGRNPHALIHHTNADGTPAPVEDCPILTTLRSGTRQRRRDVFWRKDGTSIPVEWASNPIIDDAGEIVGAVVTFSDISERLAVDRMKDEFVSTVSHELRTPLTSIRGSLGLLASGRLGTFSEKAQRLLDIAVGNTDRLVKLINDILDIEKLDAGKISLVRRPADVAEMLESVVDGVRPLLERARIEVTLDAASEVISFDPDRIGQTVTNLLSNAIKFSPAGSTIHVAAKRKDEQMIVSVRDEGRGIPADKLEAIFERFQQVDASDSRDKGGSGLGLAICRTIVRQHGGEIWVESVPGEGSTFFFSMPAPQSQTATMSDGSSARVLIVEDDVDLARVISTTFERYGVETMHVVTGREAIEAVRRVPPDLLILDLTLQDMDGYAIVDWMRTHDVCRDLPLLVYSALETSAAEQERLRLGPTEFLVKSRVSPEEFERRVVALLDMIQNPDGRAA